MQNYPNNKPNEDHIQTQMSWVNMNDHLNSKPSNEAMQSQMLNIKPSNVPMESQTLNSKPSNEPMQSQMMQSQKMQGMHDTQQTFGGDIGRMESLRNYGG